MEKYNKQDLIISIENSINFIMSNLDSAEETIAFYFKKHGIRNLEKANTNRLNSLFSELYAIEADLREA